jgi:glycosyltransferase involved in cell wall biosynthesis
MQAAGHEVHDMGPQAEPETARWLAARRIPFYVMPVSPTGLSPIADLQTFRVLLRTMRFVKPEVTIAYTIKPVVYGTLAAALSGVPRRYALVTGLGSAFGATGNALKKILANRVARVLYAAAMRKVHAVIFQNPDDVADFRAMNLLPAHVKVAVVNGSGVDLDHFAEAALPDAPRIVMISRLIAEKGVAEFIEAARIVKKAHPEAEFELVGPHEPGYANLPAGLIQQAVADGVVTYPGPLKDVRPAIAKASIFVLPSRYREGQPRVILEAMAMGRAVVTTDMPGCRETVMHGINGFIVPPSSGAKLAAALSVLVTNPDLRRRMGHAGRQMAVEKYEAGKVARDMLAAYDL